MKAVLLTLINDLKGKTIFLLYCFLLISPSLIFYLTKGIFTPFLPMFLLAQLSMLFILAQIARKRWIFLSLTTPLAIFSGMQWGHFYLFKHPLSEGAIAAILATSYSEFAEFVMIIPPLLVVLFLLFLASLFFIGKKIPSEIAFFPSSLTLAVLSILACFGVKYIKTKDLDTSIQHVFTNSHPFQSLVSFKKGADLLDDYKSKLSHMELLDLEFTQDDKNEAQTHVIIIGESARRQNWSLYGYDRDTNTYTSPLKEQLYIFQDVISAANSTIPSLYHTLTYNRDDRFVTLLDMANKAGFTTYWISNQPQFGFYDNPTSVLASRAQNQKFVRTISSHDDLLVQELKNVLGKDKKSLILLHLMGSHGYYHLRYPEPFQHFKECGQIKNKKKCQDINNYDNSIRYTDFIHREVINVVDDLKQTSSVVYLSDHGENLYDHDNTIGHGGTTMSKVEVEVPLTIWLSENYHNNNPDRVNEIKQALPSKLSLYDFFPSYLYFIGIDTKIDEKTNFFRSPASTERFVFDPNKKKIQYKDLK